MNKAQDKFKIRVKTALLNRDEMTVSELARRIDRPRATVSSAINQQRFPKVRKQIEKELQLV